MKVESFNTLNIEEFMSSGLLQEANRRFFHPLGLTLAVEIDNGSAKLKSIWDYREDPEGVYYGPDIIKQEAIDYVDNLLASKQDKRMELFGSIMQPVGD